MTKQDRVKAFTMRCEGLTWEQIGEALGYSPRHINRELHQLLEKPPHTPKIIYPKIAEYVKDNCFGSIEVFANELKVSPHRLRRVLVYGDRPTDKLVSKLTTTLNIDEREFLN